jgi:nicotinate phosphoribosyltransferase
VNLLASPLLTDLYQLTMLNAYFVHRMTDTAVFELFVRRLPPGRNFMMAAGLEQALEFLEQMRFGDEELDWVRSSSLFDRSFADHLSGLRFTGDVHAMPEGTVFFADEPVLRITAPLPEAQLVETRLINLVQFESMVATKAVRFVLTAPDRLLVDFGLRRAHGAEAGVLAARASYVAGFAGTATVFAGAQFGIPLFGTMAHSFVQAHDHECDAFAQFAATYPKGTTLLIDTYDTEQAARKLVPLTRNLATRGIRVGGVRLDSGDLAVLAKSVRRIFDEAGLNHLQIFASGNLDEYRLAELTRANAPIDGFGVGTSLVTSADAPSLDAVYKLEEYAGKPRRKRSAQKATWPGRKQVFRVHDGADRMVHDTVALEHERCEGEPLLEHVMAKGRRLHAPEPLDRIRARAASALERLPAQLCALECAATPYAVKISPALDALAREVDASTGEVPALRR